MFIKKKMKSKSGITLVALVVTIVVLLILAGVSLSLVVSSDGIIGRAKDAKEQYGQARENEQNTLDKTSETINEILEGKTTGGGSGTVVKVNVGETATGVATINGKAGNTNNPTIPKGYIPVNTETANWGDGSSAPAQTAVDHGLVIQDGSGNQWVWVPVEDMSKYYESVDGGVAISGSTVTTKKYTKTSIEIGTGSNKTTITRGLPNSTDYREPALTADYDNDVNAKKAGFANANDMATKMVSEYDIMTKSIEQYGGFYIGRYELSGSLDNPTEKSDNTITNTTWYDLYNACKKLGANLDGTDKEGIATRMIWGCQWDATCDFIATKGDQKNITDSGSWGNYNIKDDAKKTGYSEIWKANNIYDIAGNYWEWTQEVSQGKYRTGRGGTAVYSDFYNSPASGRNAGGPPSNSSYTERFSSHFNNYYWNLEREKQ